MYVLLTHIYFHVKIFFPDVLLHDLPSSLYNRNVYREDKLHLTTKGNDILTKWFHYSNASPPANPTLNTSPSDFASIDEDWPALPQPSPKPNPTPPIPCPLSSRNLTQGTKSKSIQPAYPNKTFSPTHLLNLKPSSATMHVQLTSTPNYIKLSSSPRPSHPIPTPSYAKSSLTPRPTQPIPLPTHTKPSSTMVSV